MVSLQPAARPIFPERPWPFRVRGMLKNLGRLSVGLTCTSASVPMDEMRTPAISSCNPGRPHN
jgi:hypothetical protein